MKNNSTMTRRHYALFSLLCLLWLPPLWAAPTVVVTSKPLHSLVAGVMDGVGEPHRLLPDGASAHAYSLRPSDMRALYHADIVFWIGPELETFMRKPLAGLSDKTQRIALIDNPQLKILSTRKAGVWDSDAPDHAHAHLSQRDPHLWLDIDNARAMLVQIAQVLSAADPAHQERYQANAQTMQHQLDTLDKDLKTTLQGLSGQPYIVFHDAYQYLERRYALTPLGALTLDPARTPGARRLHALRARIQQSQARCVFGEAQLQPALIDTLLEGSQAHYATLDPMGTGIHEGKHAYFQLMRTLADTLSGCLRAPHTAAPSTAH